MVDDIKLKKKSHVGSRDKMYVRDHKIQIGYLKIIQRPRTINDLSYCLGNYKLKIRDLFSLLRNK